MACLTYFSCSASCESKYKHFLQNIPQSSTGTRRSWELYRNSTAFYHSSLLQLSNFLGLGHICPCYHEHDHHTNGYGILYQQGRLQDIFPHFRHLVSQRHSPQPQVCSSIRFVLKHLQNWCSSRRCWHGCCIRSCQDSEGLSQNVVHNWSGVLDSMGHFDQFFHRWRC